MNYIKNEVFSRDGFGTQILEMIPGVGFLTAYFHSCAGNHKYAQNAISKAFGDTDRPHRLSQLRKGVFGYNANTQYSLYSNYSTYPANNYYYNYKSY